MDATTLSGLLARRLRTGPGALAFTDGDRDWTVADFDRAVGQAAIWLEGQGIGPGDRVALWLVNRIEWLVLYFALARRGATASRSSCDIEEKQKTRRAASAAGFLWQDAQIVRRPHTRSG